MAQGPSGCDRRGAAKVNDILFGLGAIGVLVSAAVLIFRMTSPVAEPGIIPLGKGELAFAGEFPSQPSVVTMIAACSDGEHLVSVGSDNALRVLNLENGEPVRTISAQSRPLTCLAVTPDGRLVATGADDGSIWLSAIDDGSRERELRSSSPAITCVAVYSLGTHLVTGDRDGMVRVWDIAAGRTIHDGMRHGAPVSSIALSEDGQRVLSGATDGSVLLFDAVETRQIRSFTGLRSAVIGIAFVPDGSGAVAVTRDGSIRKWNLDSGVEEINAQFPLENDDFLPCCDFSPGRTRILAGTNTKSLYLWNLGSSSPEGTVSQEKSVAKAFSFTTNPRYAVCGTTDKALRLLRLPDPPSLEVGRAGQRATDAKSRADLLSDYATKMKSGKSYADAGDFAAARESLVAAAAAVEPGTLERVTAQLAVERVQQAEGDKEQYVTHMEAGKKAADAGNYQSARQEFNAAKAILPDRAEAADALKKLDESEKYVAHMEAGKKAADSKNYQSARREFNAARSLFPGRTEAADALKKLDEADELGSLFSSAKITPTLEFDFDPNQKDLLKLGRDFAYLLITRDREPPFGLSSSPLKWKFAMEFTRPIPPQDLDVEIRLVQASTNETISKKKSRLARGVRVQTLSGVSEPPDGGWTSGDYLFRTYLVTDSGTEELEKPQTVPIGILHWAETALDVAADAVRKAGFEIKTGVQLDGGDAFCIETDGTITPAGIAFYRELLNNRTLKEPVPCGPEGIPWAPHNGKLSHYSILSLNHGWGALLYKVSGASQSGWASCRGKRHSDMASQPGELVVSINSINGYRPNLTGAFRPVKDNQYWLPDSGAFKVRILKPNFEFGTPLSARARGLLLRRYLMPPG